MADVLLLRERVHLLGGDLAQLPDLLGDAAQRQPSLVAQPAEEALQAAVEQGAALARPELGVVARVHVDPQQPLAEGAEGARRMVLELMRGHRRFRAERESRRGSAEGRAGELSGEPARRHLAHEDAPPQPRGRCAGSGRPQPTQPAPPRASALPPRRPAA